MCIFFFVVVVLLVVFVFVQVYEYNVGQLYIEYFWVLVLLLILLNGVVYFVVQNYGKENDILFGVDMLCVVFVEVYEYVYKNGMMSMQKVDSVDVVLGKDLCFVFGGYYLMLMGLKQLLVVGECFLLMLYFCKVGDVLVEIVVEFKVLVEQGGYEQYGY